MTGPIGWLRRKLIMRLYVQPLVEAEVERMIRHGLARGELEINPEDEAKPFEQWRIRAASRHSEPWR